MLPPSCTNAGFTEAVHIAYWHDRIRQVRSYVRKPVTEIVTKMYQICRFHCDENFKECREEGQTPWWIPWLGGLELAASAADGYNGFMDERPSPEYLAALRRLSGAQKLRTAAALYWGARKIKAARLRELHPDWTEEQVQQKVKEIFLHAVT
jgi:hypothetical protein